MKKVVFLIALCLLSQNATIAEEDANKTLLATVQHPTSQVQYEQKPSQNIYYKKTEKPVSVYKEAIPTTAPKIKVPTNRLSKDRIEPESTSASVENKSIQTTSVNAAESTKTQTKASSSVLQQQLTSNQNVDKNVEQQKTTIKQVDTNTSSNNAIKTVAQKGVNQATVTQKETLVVNKTTHDNEPAPMPKVKFPISKYYGKADIEQNNYAYPNEVKPSSLRAKIKKEKEEKAALEAQTKDKAKIRATITQVDFPNSKVFSQEELQELVKPLLEKPVTLEEIQKVVNDITRCYILSNYATSRAYLPPQTVSKGVLKIGLMEGSIGKVKVEGNRWTRTSYIKKQVGIKEGELLNVNELEKDVIKFNNNNTVKLKVGLSAGEEIGESDVTLNTEERFPFHLAIMTDNQGRKAVGTGRFGSMLSTDSLFGFRDRLSLGGYLGRGNRVGFLDYNIPIGNHGTRLGVSAAAGNISVVNGPMRQFGVGGTSQVYSVYVTHPWYDAEGANISSYSSANFKKSTSDIMDYKYYDKSTFSLTQGLTARRDTDRGIWYTGHFGSVGFKALSGDTDFLKYEGNVTRLHDFGKGIIGQFRVSGQYSPDNNLPWMEQFQIGGLSTVRGYSEGLLLGKSGYFASAEIITPLPFLPKRLGSDKLGYIYPREMIKGAVFMDNGMIFPYKADGSSIDGGELLMSWGLGLRVNLKEDLAARFYWGYGLKNRYDMDYKLGRFHFELTCAPDIGRLVADRKPAKKKNGEEDL